MIIMLSGKQGSGKSAASEGLRSALVARGVSTWVTRFSAPLYEMHNAVLSVAERYDVPIPENRKDGLLLQLLGTEWGRSKDPDIWIKASQKHISDVTKVWEDKGVFLYAILIEDLRFKNEFHAYPDAVRIRLEASPEARKVRANSWRDNDQHPSEVELDDYAKEGKFNLTVDTEKNTKEQTLKIITEFLKNKIDGAFKGS